MRTRIPPTLRWWRRWMAASAGAADIREFSRQFERLRSNPPMPDRHLETERYELREAPPYVFRVNRRQFVGTLGAGLLIAAWQPRADAQQDSATAPLEARLHIGEDGRITILSGKIEE